jgi:predicted dehydrogenase
MKQVTQRLKNGRIEVLDVPSPAVAAEGVLVDVRASLLSPGTERSTVEAARASLIGKARARPDQARQVLEKARSDGVRATLDAVRTRLDQPSPLGYSSAGVVLEVGGRVSDLRPGDRVACAGAGHAVHAELAYVPANLCARLPESVSFEAGSFATVGSIALHGVRQAEARIGERVAVIGLGLVGQLACRLLRAAGCEIVGIDLDAELVERARESGIDAHLRSALDLAALPASVAECDAVVITAATGSDDPVKLAGALARDRARIVVVGDVGMDLPRSSYYGKELELRLSRSYGPGRYDREYEERGLDYPIGYVRWTERRNLQAFVGLLGDGRIEVEDLITRRVPVERAADAYEQLLSGTGPSLGQVLTYAPSTANGGPAASVRTRRVPGSTKSRPSAGVIGAGSFSQRVLIPALRDAGFELAVVASAAGLSAVGAAERFRFGRSATPDEVLVDPAVELVCIASRHDSHARYAIEALEQGKAVFVEKPPALSFDELDRLREAASGRVLQVGFNRRFAPLAQRMRAHVFAPGQPVELVYRVAAGRLPADHWLNDPDEGGGRLVGEGCHFVDFVCWFLGGLPIQVSAVAGPAAEQLVSAQRFAISLGFAGGSVATIVYGSESASGVAKEVVEAHCAGRSATLHDYRSLTLQGEGRDQVVDARGQDKGHRAQFVVLRERLAGAAALVPDQLDTMAITLRALEAAGGHRTEESLA